MIKVVYEAYPQQAGLDEPAPGYLRSEDPLQIAERLADVGFQTGHLTGARWTKSERNYTYTATVVESDGSRTAAAAEINTYLKATEVQQDVRRVLYAYVIHQDCGDGPVSRADALRVAGSETALEALIYLHRRSDDVGVEEMLHSGFDVLALLHAEKDLGLRESD
ncbi:hypothetical protein [Nocardia sp. N2S4-5]|uniref:hypothetical protein n=1 Tax=Nocardia sp. N2S4-5 TaxID=3351565 RepID=UPI0037CFADB0